MFSKLKKTILPSVILSLSATLPCFAQDVNLKDKINLDNNITLKTKKEKLDKTEKLDETGKEQKTKEESFVILKSEKELAKEYIKLDLKWFANQVDERYQFGFNFDMYREYKFDAITLFTDVEINTVIEPKGSFGDIREENTPQWQPHYIEANAKVGIMHTINDFIGRLYFESRRKMFIDLPIKKNQEFFLGMSVETKNFKSTRFNVQDEFVFENNLEGMLQIGASNHKNYYSQIDMRYDAVSFKNAMFYLSASARYQKIINETDLMYHAEIGVRAENGTAIFIAGEKYKKASPFIVFGIRFGGGINQFDSKGENKKGLFFWPFEDFKLPRFNGEIRTYNANSKYLLSANLRTDLLEFNLGNVKIQPWVDARVTFKGHIEPESLFANLNIGSDFDFFSDCELIPFIESGYYHTSYHQISTATKNPGSVNWLGAYIVSKNFRSFMRDSGLIEYKVGGGYFVNTRTNLLARLDIFARANIFHYKDFHFGLSGKMELFWNKYGKTSLSINCGPEVEYTFKEKTALFVNLGYFKTEKNDISPAYIEGEGIALNAGMKF